MKRKYNLHKSSTPTSGKKYKPERKPEYWDFHDGRGPIETGHLTLLEKGLVAIAKKVAHHTKRTRVLRLRAG